MQFMKVFYNESCSICRAEINLYKKQNIKAIEWVDITQNKLAEKEAHQDNKALLRRLHVKEGNEVLGRAKAFLSLWKKIPIVFNLFSISYEVIAYFLYLKNKKQLIKNN